MPRPLAGHDRAGHRQVDAGRRVRQVAHDDRVERMDALDQHHLVRVQPQRVRAFGHRGARFKIKPRQRDLLARRQLRQMRR